MNAQSQIQERQCLEATPANARQITFKQLVSCNMRFLVLIGLVGVALSASADESIPTPFDRHLRAGEFVNARVTALQEMPMRRDHALAQVASAQSESGDSVAAAGTVRRIESPEARRSVAAGGQGGNSFADFQSLIDLIQTTVVPDTWEALGGPSTMSEYPQGIYVDPEGTVQECDVTMRVDQADNLRALLSSDRGARSDQSGIGASWRNPSELRFVSLRRLLDQMELRKIQGAPHSQDTRFLGGLSNIQYIFLESDDVVLAGPVGGIEEYQGWHRDASTKLHAMRSDFLFVCLASALSNHPFGCTIDPTTDGLREAARIAGEVKQDLIPIGQAADRLREALGMQRVEVFGTAGDTPIGYIMVEADRHMKQLALGRLPMPEPAKNYLDMVDASIAQGPPDGLLLRLWFTAAPSRVRCDKDQRVFELAGIPVRLSGQNERAVASGRRGHHTVDPRTQGFVKEFNKHFPSISQKYPIYGSLESIYRCAAVAEVLRRYAHPDLKRGLLASLASESTLSTGLMAAPRQVRSIATLHTVRHGRTRNHVLLASGGVEVNPQGTVQEEVSSYPSLAFVANSKTDQPRVIHRWWWDTKEGER